MEYLNLFDSDESDEDFDTLQAVVSRRKKIIKNRPNFFNNYDDADFRCRFRLSKEAAFFTHNLIKEKLYIGTRNNAMQADQMFLMTLRFYATGSFQQTVGDLCGVSNSSVSRAITLVSKHIADLRPDFVKMPNNPQEIQKTKKEFYNIAKFPRVIGAIDCTHIKILSPGGDDAEVFRNRKGFFSLNVQTICDSTLQIMDIVARWPGSVHDSRIFRNSRICFRLEAGEFDNGVIVADGGYENTNVVLTPLLACSTRGDTLYNESHIRTRNCVERSYGVWKRRFPVLSMGIRMKVEKVPYIVVSTAVLHNICCRFNDTTSPTLSTDVNEAINYALTVPTNEPNVRSRNNETRRRIIENHFLSL